MNRLFFSFAMIALLASCSSTPEGAEQNIELRSSMLGFSDVATYKQFVAEQCVAGNHENCCILSDGTHQTCPYPDHEGCKLDGSQHRGAKHGMGGKNGRAHGSNNGSNGQNRNDCNQDCNQDCGNCDFECKQDCKQDCGNCNFECKRDCKKDCGNCDFECKQDCKQDCRNCNFECKQDCNQDCENCVFECNQDCENCDVECTNIGSGDGNQNRNGR